MRYGSKCQEVVESEDFRWNGRRTGVFGEGRSQRNPE